MAWLYLAIAAVFEIAFALSMKFSEGFTRPLASVLTVLFTLGGVGFLTLALRHLPVSVAYPIWTAVGTLGVVILGVAWLGETLTPVKVASAIAIVGGVAGLKLASA